jgi:hypothetical protein
MAYHTHALELSAYSISTKADSSLQRVAKIAIAGNYNVKPSISAVLGHCTTHHGLAVQYCSEQYILWQQELSASCSSASSKLTLRSGTKRAIWH